jgi:mono/diheme cytochrome c family protein
MSSGLKYLIIVTIVAVLASCRAKNDYPGTEYAPNMYHSVAYEPLKQIMDPDAGNWVSSDDDPYGEYYSSNPNNPFEMNMLEPVENTVKRTEDGFLPYRIHKDSIDYAAKYVRNPIDSSAIIVADGKDLFSIYCISCHGETGQGDGLVGVVLKGIPAYNVGRVKDLPEGHIFHVVTHGKGRMGSHGSQIGIGDRWKIVRYVQTLQNQQ